MTIDEMKEKLDCMNDELDEVLISLDNVVVGLSEDKITDIDVLELSINVDDSSYMIMDVMKELEELKKGLTCITYSV